MDNATYEQVSINASALAEQRGFLLDNSNVQVMFFNGRPIGIELPTFVEMEVVGDRARASRATPRTTS